MATSAVGSTTSTTTTSATSRASIAQNFDTFLQLLTTQLKNQNPLDPLDTNQFTQQLVQFAQVEQQMSTNTNLGTLVSLQQTAQTSGALGFLGTTVAIAGDTSKLANNQATWSFSGTTPATATITITDSKGQTAYSGTYAVNAGNQEFVWDGRGNDGTAWPAGDYKINITAKDATGQTVAMSTTVNGTVDSVDLSQSPPVLTVGNRTFTIDKVTQVRRSGT
ncbi:MAG: flagellar biosynthesis protein FlgD [Rhizobiales bacterium]|nr:flagellar biosynthesis protein FlgD [Hyphomicrobiales bacterium]